MTASLSKQLPRPHGVNTFWNTFSPQIIPLLIVYLSFPGLSDHDIVQVHVLVNTIPTKAKQVPRDIPLYKKADWDESGIHM